MDQPANLYHIAPPLVMSIGAIIANNLSKAGWSWGYVSTVDSQGRTIWIAEFDVAN